MKKDPSLLYFRVMEQYHANANYINQLQLKDENGKTISIRDDYTTEIIYPKHMEDDPSFFESIPCLSDQVFDKTTGTEITYDCEYIPVSNKASIPVMTPETNHSKLYDREFVLINDPYSFASSTLFIHKDNLPKFKAYLKGEDVWQYFTITPHASFTDSIKSTLIRLLTKTYLNRITILIGLLIILIYENFQMYFQINKKRIAVSHTLGITPIQIHLKFTMIQCIQSLLLMIVYLGYMHFTCHELWNTVFWISFLLILSTEYIIYFILLKKANYINYALALKGEE